MRFNRIALALIGNILIGAIGVPAQSANVSGDPMVTSMATSTALEAANYRVRAAEEETGTSANSSTSSVLTPDTPTFDLLPLNKNQKWTYSFAWTKNDVWSGIQETFSDSGTVEYLVIDSVRTSDTTVTWSVRQTENLNHRHTRHTVAPFDSAYRIDRESIVSVVETTTGLHTLQCQARVWLLQTAPFGWGEPGTPVYRYCVDSVLTKYQTDQEHWGDNLYFSASRGLYRRWYYTTMTSNHHEEINATLVDVITTAIGTHPPPEPMHTRLFQNYPNPFNPSTTVSFELADAAVVRLAVFDPLGREVAVLLNESRNAGVHEVQFDAAGLASGVYFCRMQAADYIAIQRLLLLR